MLGLTPQFPKVSRHNKRRQKGTSTNSPSSLPTSIVGTTPTLHGSKSKPLLEPDAMYRFFNYWYPVSRHQPQILLRIAAAYPDWTDRGLIMQNYWEEDGQGQNG